MLAICSTGRCGDNGHLIGRVGGAAAVLEELGRWGICNPKGKVLSQLHGGRLKGRPE